MAKKDEEKVEVAKEPSTKIYDAFSANVMTHDWEDVEDLNRELKLGIWRQRALDPVGLYRSNTAGTWHSKDDTFKVLGEPGNKLRHMFAQCFAKYADISLGLQVDNPLIKAIGWTMIYSDRGYATVHTHPNCHVSGVYYVDDTTERQELTMATGVRVCPGDIEFINPLQREFQHKDLILNPTLKMSCEVGRMVIFPSYLPHFVHPIMGKGERIAVACNGSFLPSTKEA